MVASPNSSYRIKGQQLNIEDMLKATLSTRLQGVPRPEEIVLMAGGLGTRMMPLTKHIPKPLLPIMGRPMLEHVMCQMIGQGFGKFRFSVRHMSDQIKAHFGDGAKWNVQIRYIDEAEPLGTAGGLSLIDEPLVDPIIVANSDLITDLDYRNVVESHKKTGALLTMCTREATFQVPYGVVATDSSKVVAVEEKPTQAVTISAGMYALSPRCWDFLELDNYLDMPDFIQKLIDQGEHVASMPIFDRWVDVGRREPYHDLIEHLKTVP